MSEAATQEQEKKQPFGGKRYSRLKEPKNLSLGVEGAIMRILEKLAYADTRNIRDYVRLILKVHVKDKIKAGAVKGRITDTGDVEEID